MAKRQRRSSPADSDARAAAVPRDGLVGGDATEAPPSSTTRSLLTVWLIAHGFLVLVACGSVVEPSAVQQRLLGFFSWYVNALHLSPDGRPIYLAHGGWPEAAHQFQTASPAADEPLQWHPMATPGWVGGERRKRYQRWAKTTAGLAQQQQSGLAGLLARRAVQEPDVRRLRIVQIENRSIPLSLEAIEPPYQAAVVREGEQLRFVQLTPPRQNALPASPAVEAGSDAAVSPDAAVPEGAAAIRGGKGVAR